MCERVVRVKGVTGKFYKVGSCRIDIMAFISTVDENNFVLTFTEMRE